MNKFIDDMINEVDDYIDDMMSFGNGADYDSGVMEDILEGIRKSSVYFGASKVVLVDTELDEVVKLPFVGEYYENYEEEEDYIEEFSMYEGAGFEGSANHWDYCALEEYQYNLAKEAGFGEFFARTERYSKLSCGLPVYVAERVVAFEASAGIIVSPKASKLADKYVSSIFSGISSYWVARAIDFYGAEKTEKFLEYVKKSDIADLHLGNIGFRPNGAPVLLDYSGFWS